MTTEYLLHPAGGMIAQKKLVYEPLGKLTYIYNFNGEKGIAMAQYSKEKRTWFIQFGNETFSFDGGPLSKLLFEVPREDVIKDWIAGKYEVKDAKELYKAVKKFIKIFIDLPQEFYYNIITVVLLLSWLREIVRVMIYLIIYGKFGSGKSVLIEAMVLLMYHGFFAGNASPASIARLTDTYKLNTLHDEFDVKAREKDNEEYMLTRQGYRRGNKYVRLKEKSYEPDISDPFGLRIFTLHGTLEKALKQRGIPINIGTTKDYKLPIINIYKENYSKEIFEDLFFWYMENIISERVIQVSQVTGTSNVLNINWPEKDVDELRKTIFEEATKNFSEKEVKFLQQFQGRDIELAYIAIYVSKIYDIDILDDLAKSFEYKKEVEEEHDENFYMSKLKEVLIEFYKKPVAQVSEVSQVDGCYCIPNKDVYEAYNKKIKECGLNPISPHKFKEYLIEIGFVDNVNRKKKKWGKDSILTLFYDSDILKELGILETQATSATQETKPN